MGISERNPICGGGGGGWVVVVIVRGKPTFIPVHVREITKPTLKQEMDDFFSFFYSHVLLPSTNYLLSLPRETLKLVDQ